MPEPNEGQTPNQGTSQDQPDSPVERFKDDPAYKAMAKQIADMRAREDARVEAEEDAKRQAEIKKLEEQNEHKKIIELKEKEFDALKSKYESELKERDIKAELLRNKCNNDIFADGVVLRYNVETHGSIQDYVKSLAADEANKPYFGDAIAVEKPGGPGKPPVGYSSDVPSWEQVKHWETHGTREERIKARALVRKHKEETGEYPYKL